MKYRYVQRSPCTYGNCSFLLGQAHNTTNVIKQLANNQCVKLQGRFFDCVQEEALVQSFKTNSKNSHKEFY